MTAAQRAEAWAKYFHLYGYYPIIITRQWTQEVRTNKDIFQEATGPMEHEVFETHEVYRLPYKASLRERGFKKYRYTRWEFVYFLQRIIEAIGEKFSNAFIGMTPFYELAKELLSKDQGIEKLLITGNPFILFKFGYLLHKEFNITWVADYRDDWTTNKIIVHTGFLRSNLNKLNQYFEKKWLKTAKRFTSVSPLYRDRIADLIGIKGEVIFNGFFEEAYLHLDPTLNKEFTLTYNGTLYPMQEVEIVLEAIIRLIKNHSVQLKVNFIGLSFDIGQEQRVRNCIKGYESYFNITPRVPKAEILQIQQQSHVLLMFSYQSLKGIPSSKLFDYLRFEKPVLLCPSDQDIIESILVETGLGIICNDVESAYQNLLRLYQKHQKEGVIQMPAHTDKIAQYSRNQQTKKLAEILDGIFLL